MKNYKIIGESYFSKIDREILSQLVVDFGYSEDLVFNPQKYSKFLQNYIILTCLTSKDIDIEDLYLSRYYWLKKFYFNYSMIKGTDAGIEQQITVVLEEISNNIKNFDWNKIVEINQLIEDYD